MKFSNSFYAALIVCFLTSTVFAQSLTTTVSEQKYEDFTLAKTAELKTDKEVLTLKTVSHGVRKKKIFALVPVKVYYAEFLAAKPEALIKTDDGILASLKSAGPVQLRLTMLRDLTGRQITDSFTDALKANGIQISSTEIKTVLSTISEIQQFKKGEIFSIVGTTKDDKGYLYLQKPNGEMQTIAGQSELPSQMFSIWFGKPVDDKLADLKKELLK